MWPGGNFIFHKPQKKEKGLFFTSHSVPNKSIFCLRLKKERCYTIALFPFAVCQPGVQEPETDKQRAGL